MLIIDSNQIGFSATASKPILHEGRQVQGVYWYLNRIRELRGDFNGESMVVLWDGRSWRFDVFPEYKANRKAKPELVALKESWKAQRPAVMDALAALGICQIVASNMEADDLAARVVRSLRKTGQGGTLVTADKDWLQLIDCRIDWLDPMRNRRVDITNFQHYAKVGDMCFDTRRQFVEAKALAGDAGDGIPGVGNVGPTAAKWIMNEYGSVEALLAGTPTSDTPRRVRDFIADPIKRQSFKRNMLLVDLNHKLIPEPVGQQINRGAYNEDKFMAIAEDFNFASITMNPDRWLQHFKPAEH